MIRFNLKQILLAAMTCVAWQGLHAQLSVDINMTPEQMVQNLVGNGVQISNVTVTACDSTFGYYQSLGTEIGTSQGLLLTTGKASYAIGPNNSIGNCSTSAGTCDQFDNGCPGSTLLNQAQSRITRDATQIEFDIIPQGDSLKFKYTFASEEYNEWVGSLFNDVFGFYISGPGIGTDVNIALIPTTGQVVAINTINSLNNQAFFYNNQNPLGQFIQYDGFTRNLIAKVGGLTPCETYHLKLVIADGTDRVYDSGVFVQAIESNPVVVTTVTSNGLEYMLEGCSDGAITFTRQIVDDQPTQVSYWIGGTATNGIDYTPTIGNGIPFSVNTVTIPPNEASVTIDISPINDGIPEGQEYITIYLANPLCVGNVVLDSINFFIDDVLEVQLNADQLNTCVGDCVNLTAIIPQFAGTTYQWSSNVVNANGLNAEVCPTQATTYSIEASVGTCTGFAELTINVSSIAIELTPTPSTCNGAANGSVSVVVRDAVDPITYSWTGPNGFTSAADSLVNVLAGEYCLTATDAVGCTNTLCTTVDSLSTNLSVSLESTPLSCSTSNDGTVTTVVSGGSPSYSYSWTGPNGYSSNDANPIGLASGEYCVTVSDAIGCFVSQCTDVEALPSSVVVNLTASPSNCPNSNDGSVVSAVSGGTAPYTYEWSGPEGFTASADNISNLSAGEYCLTATDAIGCLNTACTSIEVSPSPITIDLTATPLNCPNSNDGAINAIVENGNAPYTYSWTGPNGFTSSNDNLTGLTSGEYCLTATDALGCLNTSCVNVGVAPTSVIIELTAQPLNCPNSANGSVTAVITGGTSPYSFAWTGPEGFTSTNDNLSGLNSGEYCLTATDVVGCVNTACANVTVLPSAIEITLTPTPASCAAASNGSVTSAVTGAIDPFVYSWSGPNSFTSNDANISNLGEGEYCLTIIDAEGCNASVCTDVIESVSITAISDLSDFTCNQISCNGACDGSIGITTNGGVAPYSYEWQGPLGFSSSLEDVSGLCAGIYDLTITDAAGCEYTNSYILTEPALLNLEVQGSVDLLCSGVETGEASVAANGGCAPYTYSWSHSAAVTGPVAINLGSGNYEVNVTDQNGCNSSGSVTIVINEPIDPLEVTIDEISLYPGGSSVSCFNSEDGFVNVSSTNGTAPYSFEWTNAFGETISNTEDIVNLACGAYALLVSDANDCEVEVEAELTCVDEIVVTLDVQSNPCGDPSATLGAIDVISIEGGLGEPYTTSWTGPSCSPCLTEDIADLASGDYMLVVTDSEGCPDTTYANIGQNDSFVVESDITGESCPELCDGSIDISLFEDDGSGGTGPTSFNLSETSTIQICFTATHTYVSDLAFHLVGPPSCGSPDILLSPNPVTSCNGGNNIVSLCFTNANNDAFNVCGAPTPLGGNYGAYSDGSEIDWTPILGCDANEPGWAVQIYDCISLDFGALTDATLTFSDTDGSGNLISSSYSTPVGFNSPINDNSCSSATASIFQVETTGGGTGGGGTGGGGGNPATGNFTYTWSGPFAGTPPTTQDVSGLCPGDYSVLISNGECSETFFFTVPEADPIVVDVVTANDPTCLGVNNGSININVTGGSGNFTYQWIPQPSCLFFGATTQDLNNLSACDYTVSITDQVTGCNVLSTISLEAPQLLDIVVVTSDFPGGYNVSCGDANDGSISVFATGGAPDPIEFAPFDYLFEWNADCAEIDPTLFGNNPNSPTLTNLPAGSYGVNITDANGCVTTECIELTAPDSIQSNPLITEAPCSSATGCISPNISGGSGSYIVYEWTGNIGNNQPNAATLCGLSVGVYTLTVTDSNGCQATFTYIITAGELSVEVVTANNPTCFGQNNGNIDIEVLGGSGDYSYTWSSQNNCVFFGASTQDVNNLPACQYTVNVVDQASGCEVGTIITLNQPAVMELTLVLSTLPGGNNVSCFDSNDGTISAIVTGGTPDPVAFAPYDYFYNWTAGCDAQVIINPADFGNDPNSPNLTNLPAGQYGIEVTDANGCLATTCLDMLAPDSIQSPAIIQNITCDNNIACIIPNVQGGSNVFTSYTWTGDIGTNAPDADTLCGLAAGLYSLTVTDTDGCDETFNYEITGVAFPVITIGPITPTNCFNTCEGAAEFTGTDGVAPYTILVDGVSQNIETAGIIDSLCQGAHEITIVDVNGCEGSAQIVVDSPTEIDITTTILIQEVTQTYSLQCNGDSSGSILSTVSGGFEPYTYSWINSSNEVLSDSTRVDSLIAGAYTLVVTDATGCANTETVTITEPELPLIATATITEIICPNGADGSISVQVTGGLAPYTLDWAGTGTLDGEALQDNLTAGSYTLVVIDTNSCQYSLPEIVLENPAPIFVITNNTDITCYESCNGSISVTSVEGVGPNDYTLSWTLQDLTPVTVFTDLCAGAYIYTLTDTVRNCVETNTVTLAEPTELDVTLNLVPDCNLLTLQAAATVSGGTGSYSYDWSNGGTESTTAVTSSGVLDLTITDGNGCEVDTTFGNVNAPAGAISITGTANNTSCGVCDGSIDASITGGFGAPYTFTWSNGSDVLNPANLCGGSYTITVTDALLCESANTFTIDQTSGITVTLETSDVSCAGDSTGTASFLENTESLIVTWTNEFGEVVGTGAPIIGLPQGDYTVEAVDIAGCTTGLLSFSINEPSELSVVITLSEFSIATNTYNISAPNGNNGSIDVEVNGGTPAYTFNWTPNSIGTDVSNPTGLSAGEFTLQIQDANGCTIDTIITLVDPDELKLYTALSPNGDGFNDTYVIDGVQDCQDNFFKVFNRWGNLVYEKNSYMNEWFGQDKDGDTLSDGTYFVIFEGCGEKFNTYVDLRRN